MTRVFALIVAFVVSCLLSNLGCLPGGAAPSQSSSQPSAKPAPTSNGWSARIHRSPGTSRQLVTSSSGLGAQILTSPAVVDYDTSGGVMTANANQLTAPGAGTYIIEANVGVLPGVNTPNPNTQPFADVTIGIFRGGFPGGILLAQQGMYKDSRLGSLGSSPSMLLLQCATQAQLSAGDGVQIGITYTSSDGSSALVAIDAFGPNAPPNLGSVGFMMTKVSP